MTEGWRFVLLGYRSALAEPLYLLLIPLVLLLGLLGFRQLRQASRTLRSLFSPRLIGRLAPDLAPTRPIVRTSLVTAGLVLLAAALAEPQCGTRTQLVKRRGVDVVVALDASKSMLARDVKPNRLARAKLELMSLLDSLKGDRVGIVVFAGDAFIQCPLTSDYEAAQLFLRAIDPDQMQQGGTNVGAALQLAKQVLTGVDRGAKRQVVVLLSDGEDFSGEVDSAVSDLKEANIPVLAVGIGSESGEPIPLINGEDQIVDYQKDSEGNVVLTRLNRSGLTAIAQATGGELFYEESGVAVPEVAERIDRMQKSELESRLTVEYDEQFQLFAWPGLLLWTIGVLLRPSRAPSRAIAQTTGEGGAR